MNKEQALARIEALENEAKELRRILEHSDNGPFIAPELQKNRDDDLVHHCITFNDKLGLSARVYYRADIPESLEDISKQGNCFSNSSEAREAAEAIETLLLSRRHHLVTTVESLSDNFTDGYVVSFNSSGEIDYDFWSSASILRGLSPVFSTRKDLETFVADIGEERLKHMFLTLAP